MAVNSKSKHFSTEQREKRQTSPLMPPINFDIADQKRVNVTVSKCDMTLPGMEMEGK